MDDVRFVLPFHRDNTLKEVTFVFDVKMSE